MGLLGAAIVRPAAEAAPRRPFAPLDYHATVVNGRITGSGFMIASGLAVTNAHVVHGCRPGARVAMIVPGHPDRRIRAEVRAISPRIDLALITVGERILPAVDGSADYLGVGSPVVAAGVTALKSGPGRRMSITGEVTSRRRFLEPFGPGVIAQMPGIRKGFSGGPVFDDSRRWVGMVAALRARGRGSVGHDAFILTAGTVRREAQRLLA